MSTAVAPAPTPTTTDPRVAAFCAPDGPEVFSAIVHGTQIWTPDPFDVETIHADARAAFDRLVGRASAVTPPPHGKSLLLLGEAGSGKTHLMRAFRTAVHAAGVGYCGYLQMKTRADNYARYLLSNVIDSLEQPYRPGSQETGLNRLARGVLDALDMIPVGDREQLADDLLEPDQIARLVYRFADIAVQDPRFKGIDLDLLRAVLFTVPDDGRIRARILAWLRCEDLNKFDRELIGDLVPRPAGDMPMRTLGGLGRLAHAVHHAAFVLFVDQIEEVWDFDREGEQKGDVLRRMVNAVVDLMDEVPNAVVVLGCLDDLFVKGRNLIPGPKLDRLEHDPEPVTLRTKRTADEIAEMLGRRLEALFDAADVLVSRDDPAAPYSTADVAGLVSYRPRDILDNVRRHRAECITAGAWVPPKWRAGGDKLDSEWEPRWNDFWSAYKAPILSDEKNLADLLAFTIDAVSDEMPNGVHFGTDPDGRFVPVEVHGAGNAVDKLLVAVCDKSTRGGGLTNQLKEVAAQAGELPAVLVRSTDFPTGAKTEAVKLIAPLVAPRGKGRRVVVANADWRAMAAFRDFHAKHGTQPGFAAWQKADRPLGELPAVHAILALDKLLAAPPAAPVSPSHPPLPPVGVAKAVVAPAPTPPPAPVVAATGTVHLGKTRGAAPAPVALAPAMLCRHAAFLGGSGSGKTTAALTVIEQLLLAGVPAVLLDRKGDLSRYADPTAWTDPEPDPDRAARRDRLRAAVDVALYTPGNDAGRALTIPVVPADLGQMPKAEREQTAQYAAAALGGMMGYKAKGTDPKLVILQRAIEVMATVPGTAVTVQGLQELVADLDDALTTAVGGFEPKHYRRLAEDLLVLKSQRRRLLEGGVTLDVDALLGRGPAGVAGKTRLAVINTQFLGDVGTTDFWVAQFLLAVDRWRAKNPSADGRLQAVFLFDEADLYLPATRQPATKGPMEGLLKRARSAGVGVFLATQSPGDLDYKCRDQVLTWLIGRVKEPVAIGKLRPMLESRPDAADKLAGQAAGEFYLVRESDVTPIRADRNLIPTAQLPEDRALALARAGVA